MDGMVADIFEYLQTLDIHTIVEGIARALG